MPAPSRVGARRQEAPREVDPGAREERERRDRPAQGATRLGRGCTVRSGSTITDSVLGYRVTVRQNCVIASSEIASDAVIGPFAHLRDGAIIDAEAVWLDTDGIAQFDALHSRVMDHTAVACAFDLMMLDGNDLRRKPLAERKATLRKVLRRTKGGIQYVEHTEGDGAEMFKAICKLGLEGIVSKRIDAPYRSGPSKSWIKVKNPKAAAATRIIDGGF